MVATSSSERTLSVRYVLSHRLLAGDEVDIVLDLYRGATPVLTRTIARVTDAELGPVTLKCRSYLERRGARPMITQPAEAFPAAAAPRPLAQRAALAPRPASLPRETASPALAPRPRAPRAAPAPRGAAAPVAAFDWLFAG